VLQLHTPILEAADAAAKALDRAGCLNELRKLGLDDFALVLFNLPLRRYPHLSLVLPRMATKETQEAWTGATGPLLLAQSLGIIRILESCFWRNTGRPLSTARSLDYGCGYGRLMRLMYFYQDPLLVFGCDPWEDSLKLCKQSGLTTNIAVTDYLPKDLPYPDGSFDLIHAFSVFTHLSERATRHGLTVLRQKIKGDGILIVTIRPVEYWAFAKERGYVSNAAALRDRHLQTGFAFAPHNREPVDGDVTYGDTTIALDYLEKNFPEWKLVSMERQLNDNLQLFVTLKPA
jgi:SAM-dependent methyltransferase